MGGAMTEIKWHEEEWPLDRLKAFDRNPRTISDKQMATLKDAIKRLGYHHPIAAQPDGLIISGHQRAEALRDLGHTTIRVSIPSRPLDDDEFQQMSIQSNINNGEWDFGKLQTDFKFDKLKEWGMPADWLAKAKPPFEEEAEDVPEPQIKVVSAPRDVWLCGQHRVMCGDSTSASDVELLLGGAKPNLMVTDPPYGVEYDPNWRNEADRANGKPYGARAVGVVMNDERADWRAAWALFNGNIAYVWHAGVMAANVADSLTASGFDLRSQIIWRKSNFAIGRGDYHWQHEPCWYAVRTKGDWHGDRKQTTIWDIDKPQKSETGHSTQKPIECMRRPMINNSAEGDAVYDPFLGSGTTMIAAEQTNRHCIGMEISPAYVDVIVRRWQTFTGKAATLASTGETFEAVEKART